MPSASSARCCVCSSACRSSSLAALPIKLQASHKTWVPSQGQACFLAAQSPAPANQMTLTLFVIPVPMWSTPHPAMQAAQVVSSRRLWAKARSSTPTAAVWQGMALFLQVPVSQPAAAWCCPSLSCSAWGRDWPASPTHLPSCSS